MKELDKNVTSAISSQICIGRLSAKTNAALRDVLKINGIVITDAVLREHINTIRKSDPKKMLCGDHKGYYWAENEQEAGEYLSSLGARIGEMQEVFRALSITKAKHYTLEGITTDLLVQYGFEFKIKKAYEVYEHPKGYIFKASINAVGVWGLMENEGAVAPKVLFHKRAQLLTWLEENCKP